MRSRGKNIDIWGNLFTLHATFLSLQNDIYSLPTLPLNLSNVSICTIIYSFSVTDIKPEILDIVHECTAKTRQCYLSASVTFRERQWSNYTALNAWMSTLQSLRGTTIPMGHILALVSHTCFLWCIQNIGRNLF